MRWLIKVAFKLFIFAAVFWCVYSVLPVETQAKLDRSLDEPIYVAQKAHYESYRFLCEFFGRTREQSLEDAEQYMPARDRKEREQALRHEQGY